LGIVKFLLDNIWLIGIAALSGGALLWPNLQRSGKNVSILQATQLLNQGKAVILDVREPAEFAAGHMRDAKNIPLNELSNRADELGKFKSKTLIVICKSGTRSGKALGQLKKVGFDEAFSLDGGMAAWQAQGLPVAK
jgi:rhodanese-related sulfurtransferase